MPYRFFSKERQELMKRRNKLIATLGIRTEVEREAHIDALIARAVVEETQRDACVYESPEYWKYHDRAIKLHLQAELLMS